MNKKGDSERPKSSIRMARAAVDERAALSEDVKLIVAVMLMREYLKEHPELDLVQVYRNTVRRINMVELGFSDEQ